MDPVVNLPTFSKLYVSFGNAVAKWMLCTLFTAQLIQEMTVKSPSSKVVITNMLEEVLLNCSARELKTNRKDKRITFTHVEVFTTAFISLIKRSRKK